jgi:hypothetical protein
MIHVGIEMSRDLRLNAAGLVQAGTLEAGGVNLLRHALTLARRITEPGLIRIMTTESDETVLALVGEFECREGGALQWMAELVDAAPNAAPEDAVIILRQTAPLRDESPLREALGILKKQRCVVSASKPPKGHARHKPLPGQTEPDYQVRAFEAWRLGEFGKYGFTGPMAEPPLLFIDWETFVEIDRPQDFERAGRLLAKR